MRSPAGLERSSATLCSVCQGLKSVSRSGFAPASGRSGLEEADREKRSLPRLLPHRKAKSRREQLREERWCGTVVRGEVRGSGYSQGSR